MRAPKLFLILLSILLLSAALFGADAEIPRVDPAIAIDGVPDPAWAQVNPNYIEFPFVGADKILDEFDLFAEWKALHDELYFYLLVVVTDDEPNDDTEGIGPDDDSLDIMFDVDNGDEDAPEAEDDFMITVEYSSTGECLFSGTKCCGFGEYFDEEILAMCTDTDSGYIIEAAFPMEDFPFDGTETFGFGLRVNDDDDGDARDSQISWYIETGMGWNKPADLADVAFTDTVIPNVASAVEVDAVPVHSFELSQNYPNPFNPATTISYAVNKTGVVELNVYDLLGEHVATLVNDIKTAGVHHVTFDAHDLSSGVYIYTLKSAESVLSNKMILMK